MLSPSNIALYSGNPCLQGLSTLTAVQQAPSRSRLSQGRNTLSFLLFLLHMRHVTRRYRLGPKPPNVRFAVLYLYGGLLITPYS